MRRWIALVESLALERVHENPRIETIKALASRAEYQSLRFVIYRNGDLMVGDAGKFTHQQIAPATSAWAAYGYVDHRNHRFIYVCFQPYSKLLADHPLLRRFEQHGIKIDPDAAH